MFYYGFVAARRSQRPYNVEYYRRNRDLEIARVRVRQAGMVELLRDLRRVPCAQCGGRFKPYQMDFDHRDPAAKTFKVTEGRAMLMPTSRVMAEVAKCDIVCANCHRIRTREFELRRPRKAASRAPAQVLKRLRWQEQASLLDWLRDVSCGDCGKRFPPAAMDFDHRDSSKKLHAVSRMVGRATSEAILAEAAKCDIVCANCHRHRTFQRREASGRE
jgi:hypothetical protein